MELDLCDRLREFLQQELKNIVLPTRGPDIEHDGKLRSLKIFDSYLPVKQEDSEDPYPFVIVRATSSATDEQILEINVSMFVGTYAKDSAGFRDALNVVSAIRNSILPFTQSALANKFHLMPEIKWDTLEDQPWPYWQMEIKTKWSLDFPICRPAMFPNGKSGDYEKSLRKALYG
ncbi:hypothetical protein [Turicimonas sp. TL08]